MTAGIVYRADFGNDGPETAEMRKCLPHKV